MLIGESGTVYPRKERERERERKRKDMRWCFLCLKAGTTHIDRIFIIDSKQIRSERTFDCLGWPKSSMRTKLAEHSMHCFEPLLNVRAIASKIIEVPVSVVVCIPNNRHNSRNYAAVKQHRSESQRIELKTIVPVK